MLDGRDAGEDRESPSLTVLSVFDLFGIFGLAELSPVDFTEVPWSPFLVTLDLEETLALEDLVLIACDFDELLTLDLETFDLEVDVLLVLELLRLRRCFMSDSVLLHLVAFDLDCVELCGLAAGARGRGPAGSDSNTPNRVEGPAALCPVLTVEKRWWEVSLFIEEDRDSPKLTLELLHTVELDTCELVRKLEKELEVDLAMLEVITWEVMLPPPPPQEELHPPTRLLLSILV